MELLTKIIARNMRRRRVELGMTQRELAERISYSEKAISKWERGAGLPPSAVLPELSNVLRIGIDELMREASKIEYYLGVDCGGFKTEFALTDARGRLIGRIMRAATNNATTSYSEVENTLYDGVFDILHDISPVKVSLCIGLSGESSSDARRIREFFTECGFCRVNITSNVMVAIRTSLGEDGDGIMVNLGAGSVAFGRFNGQYSYCGGYGYIFGDDCSGYDLGRQVIRAVRRYDDGTGPYTVMYDYLSENEYYGHTPESHTHFYMSFYNSGKSSVMQYAPFLFRAVRAGDAVADRILRASLVGIVDLIRTLAQKTDRTEVKLVLCGGLMKSADIIVPILRSMLAEDVTREYEIVVHSESMVCGAVYLAGLDSLCEFS